MHEWMLNQATLYAAVHPDNAHFVMALPYLADCALIIWGCMTMWLGLRAQWAYVTRWIPEREGVVVMTPSEDKSEEHEGYVQRADGTWMHERRSPRPPYVIEGYDVCEPPLSGRPATIVKSVSGRTRFPTAN